MTGDGEQRAMPEHDCCDWKKRIAGPEIQTSQGVFGRGPTLFLAGLGSPLPCRALSAVNQQQPNSTTPSSPSSAHSPLCFPSLRAFSPPAPTWNPSPPLYPIPRHRPWSRTKDLLTFYRPFDRPAPSPSIPSRLQFFNLPTSIQSFPSFLLNF